jgi:hypothetical protein
MEKKKEKEKRIDVSILLLCKRNKIQDPYELSEN